MFLRSYSSRALCDFITVWKNRVLWITIKFKFCLFSLLPLRYLSVALLLSLLKWLYWHFLLDLENKLNQYFFNEYCHDCNHYDYFYIVFLYDFLGAWGWRYCQKPQSSRSWSKWNKWKITNLEKYFN